jgi:hypothetical protein
MDINVLETKGRFVPTAVIRNATLSGKKLLAKISEERTKSQLFFVRSLAPCMDNKPT